MCFLYFVLLFFSCSDNLLVKVESLKPEILVHPENLFFGNLESGFESEEKFFSIINTGSDDLHVFAPELFDGSNRFNAYDLEEKIIEPGELYDVFVVYTPETYEHNGAFIEIESNDEETPSINVTLEGYGDAPVMSINPEEVDYGDISIGCDNEERVTITNDGNMVLEIDSVVQMVTQPADIIMEFGSLPEPPWSIDPGLSLDFLISYIPSDVGNDSSSVEIHGNDPAKPSAEIFQDGYGDVEEWHSQTHIQEEIPVLDILWVVDDSGSMNRFQNNLSSNIGLFVNAFIATGADYRMAVITTTHSQIGMIIDHNTPSPESAISNEVLVGIGGHGMEKGLETSRAALSNSSSAGPGGNFFREDATLAVIYVSDEPDHSGSWSNFINFFDTIKPPGEFIPYAVIGDHPSGCSMQGYGSAQYGSGYWDIVDYYGGSWYSICAADWGVQLQNMANSMAGRRAYNLEEEDPIESTITVTVNGQVVNEWYYDPNTNQVIFSTGSVPDAGQTIGIEYAVWGC